MDVKLEKLIEKLKKEGVEEAKKEAAEIIAKAEKEAKKIVETAKKDAERSTKEAEETSKRFQENSERALQQAARDTILSLRDEITDLFDRVFRSQVNDALSTDILGKMILTIMDKWDGKSNLEIECNTKQVKDLEKILLAALKKKGTEGIHLEGRRDMEGGFYIHQKGKDLYYDFSDQSISEMLMSFLNRRLNEILEGKDG